MALLPHGAVKPPIGRDRLDPTHPFVRQLLFGAWFNHGGTGYTAGTTNLANQERVVPTWGRTPRRTTNSAFATDVLESNQAGVCGRFSTSALVDFGPDPIPANQVTVCIVKRKLDTTNRNGYLFGTTSPATFTRRCTVSAPWGDGVVYWDFGGTTSGTTRLSKSGLTFSTTTPERWVFIAGSRGMAIWQNGVKVASHATANPGRVVNLGEAFRLGAIGPLASDVQDINFCMVLDDQWSDELCRWWSAEPYAHLYGDARRDAIGWTAAAGAARSYAFLGPSQSPVFTG